MTEEPSRPAFPDLGTLAKVAGAARDATYVAVGLGVLGLQRALVHRAEIQQWLEEQAWVPGDGPLDERFGEVRSEVARHADQLDTVLERAMRQVESSLEPLEAQLPDPARAIAERAHTQAHDVRIRLKELLSSR